MLLNVIEYYRPETIEDALHLLRRPSIKTALLAGGTLLVGRRDDELQAVIDLRALGLDTIREQDGQIHLGAMVTLQMLVDSPLIHGLAGGVLAQSAKSSAARLIRNAATIGGTLAAGPAANADLAVVLAALGARARLVGETERMIPAEHVFEERQPGELLAEVIVEHHPAETEGAFLRVARSPDDVALVHAATLLLIRGGICQQLAVAVGGVGMAPVRLRETEHLLIGKNIGQEQISAAVAAGLAAFVPPPDFRASPAYRQEVTGVLARRALEQCADAARWRQLMDGDPNQGTGR